MGGSRYGKGNKMGPSRDCECSSRNVCRSNFFNLREEGPEKAWGRVGIEGGMGTQLAIDK